MTDYRFRTRVPGSLLLALFLSSSAASADVMLNEFLIEPSGPQAGQQFFELKGTANQSLSGISLLVLIGDPLGSGFVDQVLDLSPFSLGANGLLLHHDDPMNLVTPPDPGTTVLSGLLPLPSFFPNLSLTFALVRDFTGMPFDDLDTNDDGILDVTPWSSVVDAVGIRANLPGLPLERAFGTQLGFTDFPIVGFDPDGIFRDGLTNKWYASDVSNDFGGPYTIDPGQFVDTDLTPQNLAFFDKNVYTPGAVNAAVPEPSAFIALGVIGMACCFRRRRQGKPTESELSEGSLSEGSLSEGSLTEGERR